MQDRISVNPGRVLITPENGGSAYYATMTRADNPTQSGTPLNKASLLSDATAALFGLGADSAPNDVFGVLSRFQNGLGNEYVWAKSSKIGVSVITKSNSTSAITIKNVDSGITVYTTASIVNGEIVLSMPISVSYSAGSGYYIYSGGAPYQLDGKPGYGDSNAYYNAYLLSVGTATESQIVGYVNSPDPNAYPIDDGYTYTALGQLGNKVQIATGSYTGTGTSGKDNRTSLTLDFVPKFIIVARNAMDTLEDGISVRQMDVMVLYPAVGGFSTYMLTSSLTNFYSVGSEVNGNTVLWWSKYDQPQMNASGKKYNYVAIG